jgi:hypothetical protein
MKKLKIGMFMVFFMFADVFSQPIQDQIPVLESLCKRLKNARDIHEKLEIINQQSQVQDFQSTDRYQDFLNHFLDPDREFVVKAVVSTGQGPTVFEGMEDIPDRADQLSKLIADLLELEEFYYTIGGIVGYHLTILKLISEKESGRKPIEENIQYYKPEGMDLTENKPEVHRAVRCGIESLKKMAEIYTVGGAADRLQLKDEITGEPLPSAQLHFGGHTLLERLIRDLQGREYLYYKLFGEQLVTPIVMMTSHEKHNHARIYRLCKECEWFGRSPENFKIFIQPLVPVVTKEGKWVMCSPLKPMVKPGGHGVIWKKALDVGVFDWLKERNRSKALVRQINNPVAGVDHGLLALTGIGCWQDKHFGFASCFRRLNTPEGMNILIEKKIPDGYEYLITNIEYTDFEQKGIEDTPESKGSLYSRFPANTNILFIDLQAVEKAVNTCPIPGMLINMKNSTMTMDSAGRQIPVQAGRLESTMQNIADYLVDIFPTPLKEGERDQLRTFLTYNLRRKTISVTKESYTGKCLFGTPEGCFYELMQNYRDLLANYCHMEMPSLPEEKDYIEEGPSFIAHFHPVLGMLFHVIGQKIRGGVVAPGSEWVMEIAEADIENLKLNGSLLIQADQMTGHKENQMIIFGDQCGKCILKNVTVENEGIDWDKPNRFWKNEISRKECLEIILHGNAEFFAEEVTLRGGRRIEVPHGHRMIASENEGELFFKIENISSPTWSWKYTFGPNDQIILSKAKQ